MARVTLGSIAFCAILMACWLVMPTSDRVKPGTLKNEIYQVRGQLQFTKITGVPAETQVQTCAVVMLRNGRGKDFTVEIPKPLPPDVYFVRPAYDLDGNCILVRVPTIVEEQAQKGDRR